MLVPQFKKTHFKLAYNNCMCLSDNCVTLQHTYTVCNDQIMVIGLSSQTFISLYWGHSLCSFETQLIAVNHS